jgi:hypothetical protein
MCMGRIRFRQAGRTLCFRLNGLARDGRLLSIAKLYGPSIRLTYAYNAARRRKQLSSGYFG